MNNSKINKRINPRKVIVVYHDNHRQNFYLESRDIQNGNLMAPVPLSDDVMKDIAKSYMKTNSANMTHEAFIPANMLHGSNRLGKTMVMWFQPAMQRSLNFSSALKIKGDKPVMVPATLYLVINRTLYLFALDSNDRPDPKTKLYYAPFFNIYEDGNVCMGTAHTGKAKAKTFEKEAERFERAFYMAEQNGGERNTTKTNISKLWTALINKKQPFPKKELIQHKKYKTLGALVSKFIGNNNDYDDDED